MSSEITRENLLQSFLESEIKHPTEQGLAKVSDPTTRRTLQEIGLPVWENAWFEYDETLDGDLEAIIEVSSTLQVSPAPASTHLICIAMVPYDTIAFDPSSGIVYCIPQEGPAYILNKSLHNFIHFLYVLQSEAPSHGLDGEWDTEELDLDAARARIQQQWREIDPVALSLRSSVWYRILLHFVDPEAHHHADALTYPYPHFEEDLIIDTNL